MSYLLALAAATSALSPQSTQDLRCVALLGIVAYEQGRDSEWRDMAPIKTDGERFAGVVGERVMKETGKTREAVKELILADVAALQKAKNLLRGEVDSCIARMAVVAPPPPPPELPRCAAILLVAAENVKAREGLSKGAKDLATLASILAYRARVEGVAAGKTEAQVTDAIAIERAAAIKAGAADEGELQSCADLAAAD
jgi:hypothetical protein